MPTNKLTDKERKELEELRALRAKLEAEKKAEAEKPKPKTKEEQVWDYYNQGKAIQDIARIMNLAVEEVLVITKNEDLLHIGFSGDQIDASEIGPQAQFNQGVVYKVPYTLN